MSSGLEHRECADALPAYALGALSESDAELVRRHLDGCRECRAELDSLRAAVDALPSSVPAVEPPAELKRRVMAIVESEAQPRQAAGTADRTRRSRSRRRLPWSGPAGWRVATGVAAACIAAVVIVLALGAGGPGTRTIRAQLTPRFAGAEAWLRLEGTRGQLVVRGLPAPAPGHVDQIWVKRGSAPAAAAGTFVLRSGSVDLAQPVHSGDLVLVTVEPGEGTTAPTTPPVLLARA